MSKKQEVFTGWYPGEIKTSGSTVRKMKQHAVLNVSLLRYTGEGYPSIHCWETGPRIFVSTGSTCSSNRITLSKRISCMNTRGLVKESEGRYVQLQPVQLTQEEMEYVLEKLNRCSDFADWEASVNFYHIENNDKSVLAVPLIHSDMYVWKSHDSIQHTVVLNTGKITGRVKKSSQQKGTEEKAARWKRYSLIVRCVKWRLKGMNK